MKRAIYELVTHSVGGTSIKDFIGTRPAARRAARELDINKHGERKIQTTRVRFIKYVDGI